MDSLCSWTCILLQVMTALLSLHEPLRSEEIQTLSWLLPGNQSNPCVQQERLFLRCVRAQRQSCSLRISVRPQEKRRRSSQRRTARRRQGEVSQGSATETKGWIWGRWRWWVMFGPGRSCTEAWMRSYVFDLNSPLQCWLLWSTTWRTQESSWGQRLGWMAHNQGWRTVCGSLSARCPTDLRSRRSPAGTGNIQGKGPGSPPLLALPLSLPLDCCRCLPC